MNKIFKILLFPLKVLMIAAIKVYKILISPLLPKSCIYTPTCSTYGIQAIKKHGVFRGFLLTFNRICRCSPWHNGGYDPVQLNIKGEDKWII